MHRSPTGRSAKPRLQVTCMGWPAHLTANRFRAPHREPWFRCRAWVAVRWQALRLPVQQAVFRLMERAERVPRQALPQRQAQLLVEGAVRQQVAGPELELALEQEQVQEQVQVQVQELEPAESALTVRPRCAPVRLRVRHSPGPDGCWRWHLLLAYPLSVWCCLC